MVMADPPSASRWAYSCNDQYLRGGANGAPTAFLPRRAVLSNVRFYVHFCIVMSTVVSVLRRLVVGSTRRVGFS